MQILNNMSSWLFGNKQAAAPKAPAAKAPAATPQKGIQEPGSQDQLNAFTDTRYNRSQQAAQLLGFGQPMYQQSPASFGQSTTSTPPALKHDSPGAIEARMNKQLEDLDAKVSARTDKMVKAAEQEKGRPLTQDERYGIETKAREEELSTMPKAEREKLTKHRSGKYFNDTMKMIMKQMEENGKRILEEMKEGETE